MNDATAVLLMTPATELWDAIVPAFRKLELGDFRMRYNAKSSSRSIQLYPRYVIDDRNTIHYEWLLQKKQGLEVALRFNFPSDTARAAYVRLLVPHEAEIRRGIAFPFDMKPGGSTARFTLPFDAAQPSRIAAQAVRVMERLIGRTWPLIEPLLPRDSSLV